jgi:hypothetical protein
MERDLGRLPLVELGAGTGAAVGQVVDVRLALARDAVRLAADLEAGLDPLASSDPFAVDPRPPFGAAKPSTFLAASRRPSSEAC